LEIWKIRSGTLSAAAKKAESTEESEKSCARLGDGDTSKCLAVQATVTDQGDFRGREDTVPHGDVVDEAVKFASVVRVATNAKEVFIAVALSNCGRPSSSRFEVSVNEKLGYSAIGGGGDNVMPKSVS